MESHTQLYQGIKCRANRKNDVICFCPLNAHVNLVAMYVTDCIDVLWVLSIYNFFFFFCYYLCDIMCFPDSFLTAMRLLSLCSLYDAFLFNKVLIPILLLLLLIRAVASIGKAEGQQYWAAGMRWVWEGSLLQPHGSATHGIFLIFKNTNSNNTEISKSICSQNFEDTIFLQKNSFSIYPATTQKTNHRNH